jgi:hypothetical protein
VGGRSGGLDLLLIAIRLASQKQKRAPFNSSKISCGNSVAPTGLGGFSVGFSQDFVLGYYPVLPPGAGRVASIWGWQWCGERVEMQVLRLR